MKKSYIVYSAILLVLVLVMIIGGVIQDKRLREKQVEQCAANTMLSVGCVEYSKGSKDTARYAPDKENIDTTAIDEIIDRVAEKMDLDDSTREKLATAVQTMLEDTTYQIIDTKVNGRDATVTVRINYEDHVGEVDLKYFYYDGEWMLSNSADVIKSILVDGESYDIDSDEVKDKVISYFENV